MRYFQLTEKQFVAMRVLVGTKKSAYYNDQEASEKLRIYDRCVTCGSDGKPGYICSNCHIYGPPSEPVKEEGSQSKLDGEGVSPA